MSSHRCRTSLPTCIRIACQERCTPGRSEGRDQTAEGAKSTLLFDRALLRGAPCFVQRGGVSDDEQPALQPTSRRGDGRKALSIVEIAGSRARREGERALCSVVAQALTERDGFTSTRQTSRTDMSKERKSRLTRSSLSSLVSAC